MSRWSVAEACLATVVTVFASMLMLHLDARATSTQVYAPVELYTPFPPGPFEGSDGQTHLAYEVHQTR